MREGEPKPKQDITFDEAKPLLLGCIKTGMIHQLREIFEKYNVPDEIKEDLDIQWYVDEWKAYMRLDSESKYTTTTEPIEETLAFLDEKFSKKI